MDQWLKLEGICFICGKNIVFLRISQKSCAMDYVFSNLRFLAPGVDNLPTREGMLQVTLTTTCWGPQCLKGKQSPPFNPISSVMGAK